MLTTLFGDLGGPGDRRRSSGDEGTGFAATTILETVAARVNEQGQIVDRHSHDLVVTGSPAAAIREHYASTRSDLETATRQITLLDPTGVWAPMVIKALSDAGGQPVERLHLREQTTLRTLAMIERTSLVRRHEDQLKIYHADVRAPGHDNAEIPMALMERSHMTAVIIGALQPHAIDSLLTSLSVATRTPAWRCPNLLFMLPPSAAWIANKIHGTAWPSRLNVLISDEPLTSASAVWNTMLGVWNRVRLQPVWEPPGPALAPQTITPISITPPAVPPAITPAAPAPRHGGPDAAATGRALVEMMPLDGLLACAVVEADSGFVIARELREDHPVDIEVVAAACSRLLREHRSAAKASGVGEPIEELLIGSAQRQQVLRVLTRYPGAFVVALLDRRRSNLPLARYKLLEFDRGLV